MGLASIFKLEDKSCLYLVILRDIHDITENYIYSRLNPIIAHLV